MTFEEWYEEHVKYMTTTDFKPWLHEAWLAGQEAAIKTCEWYAKQADEAYQESDSDFDAGEANGAIGCTYHIRKGMKK